MATPGDVAIAGCDDALKDCIKFTAKVLADCLSTAGGDTAAKNACKTAYQAGLTICKEVHDWNREVVDILWPPA